MCRKRSTYVPCLFKKCASWKPRDPPCLFCTFILCPLLIGRQFPIIDGTRCQCLFTHLNGKKRSRREQNHTLCTRHPHPQTPAELKTSTLLGITYQTTALKSCLLTQRSALGGKVMLVRRAALLGTRQTALNHDSTKTNVKCRKADNALSFQTALCPLHSCIKSR
jgi:hypothetical protein